MPTYPALTTILPTQYYELEPEYVGAKVVYQDGGIDTISYADTPVRRWVIVYENITTTERDSFKTFIDSIRYNSREGSLLSFTFTPRGESAVTAYLDEGGYQPTSKKSWVHNLTIKIVKRP